MGISENGGDDKERKPKKSALTSKEELEDEYAKAQAEAKRKKEKALEHFRFLRQVDALIWEMTDVIAPLLLKMLVGEQKGYAAAKVRSRAPVALTLIFDDGWTYHAKRRLAQLHMRPHSVYFDHSDPDILGTITQAMEFYTTSDTIRVKDALETEIDKYKQAVAKKAVEVEEQKDEEE